MAEPAPKDARLSTVPDTSRTSRWARRQGAPRPEAWRWLATLPALVARGLIRVYRYSLSMLVGRTCRHLPTCSEYADVAIGRFGLWRGGWMALARFWRCRPLGSSGFDPVPDTLPADARWYRPWRYGIWGSDLPH